MEVPKYIEEAIRKNAKHAALAKQNNELIRKWMMKNNIHNDYFIDQLIDSCEMSCDPEHFIAFLETESVEGHTNDD